MRSALGHQRLGGLVSDRTQPVIVIVSEAITKIAPAITPSRGRIDHSMATITAPASIGPPSRFHPSRSICGNATHASPSTKPTLRSVPLNNSRLPISRRSVVETMTPAVMHTAEATSSKIFWAREVLAISMNVSTLDRDSEKTDRFAAMVCCELH